jgi:hypothetical protein
MTNPRANRDEMIEQIQLRLGAGMVDVELDPQHYEAAVNISMRFYRQRSTNAQIEAFIFMEVQREVSTYTLPKEIQEVRDVLRNSTNGQAGTYFEPFSANFVNNIYMLQNPGGSGLGGSGTGALASYDFAASLQKLTGRMFGREVKFTWDSSTKKITFQRKFNANEEIGLHVYMARDEESLLEDYYARPWIEDMATAQCKMMLGQGRGKFQSYAGPQGGITLNGAELKQEAQAEMDKLMEDLKNGIDGSMGFGLVIG